MPATPLIEVDEFDRNRSARNQGVGRNGIIVRPPIDRLRAKLRRDPKTGCDEWTGALDRKGYARIAMGAHRNAQAHRVAYEAERGPIPPGLTIDHLCRNKACCNPDHLEPVTFAENTRRENAQRPVETHCRRGHEWTEANTYYQNGGKRACRACRRVRDARV